MQQPTTRKFCPACEELRDRTDFGVNRSRPDGLQNTCRACRNLKARQGYAADPTRQLEIAAASRHKAGKTPRVPAGLPSDVLGLWDANDNPGVDPHQLSPTSKKLVAWRCPQGHRWQRRVVHQQAICNACVHIARMQKLLTAAPHLRAEWDSSRNDTAKIEDTQLGVAAKAWWVCSTCVFGWAAQIYSRGQGAGCPNCANQGKKHRGTANPVIAPLLLTEWSPNNDKSPGQVSTRGSYKAEWICGTCGHTWHATLWDRTVRGSGCPVCARSISKPEIDLAAWAASLQLPVAYNTRKIITPHELDIYFPDQKMAIEFNGLYWHSEAAGKDRWYHHEKWQACAAQGIQLIQIWEDDWRSNRAKVISMLEYKLGRGAAPTVYARATTITDVTVSEAGVFLDAYHMQGQASGSIRVGLRVESELCALMLIKRRADGETYEIVRYATAMHVPGGFSKLLAHVTARYRPASFVTFSDNTLGSGALYRSNGFELDARLPPDYSYLVRGQRQHKFNYRLKRFQQDTGLLWMPNMTEKELAELNNLPRVWDAGKLRWIKRLER